MQASADLQNKGLRLPFQLGTAASGFSSGASKSMAATKAPGYAAEMGSQAREHYPCCCIADGPCKRRCHEANRAFAPYAPLSMCRRNARAVVALLSAGLFTVSALTLKLRASTPRVQTTATSVQTTATSVQTTAAQLGDAAFPEGVPAPNMPVGNLPWVLDVFDGNKELVPVHRSSVQLDSHNGSNIAGALIAGPIYQSRFTTEISGNTARTPVHTSTPVFFVYVGDESESGPAAPSVVAGWAVMRLVVDKDRRLLSTVQFTQLTDNAKRSDGQLEVTTEKLPRGWLKISPSAPLTPGEYALLPVMRQTNAFSTSVFDFKVDPESANAKDAFTSEH